MRQSEQGEQTGNPGIIDTLSAGFQTINRMPWIMAIPVCLDLLLWLGPRITIRGIAERGLLSIASMLPAMTQASATSTDQADQLQRYIDLVRGGLEFFNLLSLLLVSGSMMHSAVMPNRGGGAGTVELNSVASAFGLSLIFILVGIAIACLWFGAIAQQVRDGKVDFARLIRAAPRYWVTIVGFILLVIALMIGVSIPLSFLSALLQVVAPTIGSFVTILLAIVLQLSVFWALLYLFFFTDAVVVSEVGPIRAALNSMRVVTAHFWSALGLILITWVIIAGMGVVWGSLSQVPIGQAAAIVANGYVESGLAAASLLFYSNRISRVFGAPNHFNSTRQS